MISTGITFDRTNGSVGQSVDSEPVSCWTSRVRVTLSILSVYYLPITVSVRSLILSISSPRRLQALGGWQSKRKKACHLNICLKSCFVLVQNMYVAVLELMRLSYCLSEYTLCLSYTATRRPIVHMYCMYMYTSQFVVK